MTGRTLVLVKPDGVGRKLIGEVLSRIERKGLDIVALELRTVDRGLAEQHYAEHDGKPFFGSLLEFIWARSSRPSSRARGRSPRSASWPGAPTWSRRPRRARSGATSASRRSSTSSTAPTGPSPAAREIKLWFPNL